jgi:hypothetical protein
LLCGVRRCVTPLSIDDVDVETDKLGHELSEPFGPPLRPSVLNRDAFPLDPAKVAQPLPERLEKGRGSRTAEIAYSRDPGRLLCITSKRRREEAEGERHDE